jgi:hypothetical protein
MSQNLPSKCAAHNIFDIDGVIFSSNFDNGNLANVEKGSGSHEYILWTSPDNAGTSYSSSHNAWFHFCISHAAKGVSMRLVIANASSHATLYKQDMRPVYKAQSTNNKWVRIKTSVRYQKSELSATLFFDHMIEQTDEKVYFSFTYPYTYSMVQNDMNAIETRQNDLTTEGSLFAYREILTTSPEGRNIDLVTITSVDRSAAFTFYLNDICFVSI